MPANVFEIVNAKTGARKGRFGIAFMAETHRRSAATVMPLRRSRSMILEKPTLVLSIFYVIIGNNGRVAFLFRKKKLLLQEI